MRNLDPNRRALLLMLAASACLPAIARAQPAAPIRLDHAWITTQPGAERERAALEAIGLTIAPTINRHEGQGAASATVEFENGFLELIWPDDSVSVNGEGGARGKARFVERMNWRSNGVSPFGIALARTATTPDRFPFETREVRADWMPPGTAMVMMTPRGSAAANIALHTSGVDEAANLRLIAAGGPPAAAFRHANGARRLTSVRITAPDAAGLPPSADYVAAATPTQFVVGSAWLMEMTLDGGRAGERRDLRPTLPLVLRW